MLLERARISKRFEFPSGITMNVVLILILYLDQAWLCANTNPEKELFRAPWPTGCDSRAKSMMIGLKISSMHMVIDLEALV